jgi:hypothetical protein
MERQKQEIKREKDIRDREILNESKGEMGRNRLGCLNADVIGT